MQRENTFQGRTDLMHQGCWKVSPILTAVITLARIMLALVASHAASAIMDLYAEASNTFLHLYGMRWQQWMRRERHRTEGAWHDKISRFITIQTPLPREWSSLNIHFIFAGSPHWGVTAGSKGGLLNLRIMSKNPDKSGQNKTSTTPLSQELSAVRLSGRWRHCLTQGRCWWWWCCLQVLPVQLRTAGKLLMQGCQTKGPGPGKECNQAY